MLGNGHVSGLHKHMISFMLNSITHRFGCLFCHGYEDRGAESAGVLAIGDLAAVFPSMLVARMAKRLAGDVTIYTDNNESLSKQFRESLGKSLIKVDNRPIARLEKSKVGAEVIIHFADDSVQTEGFLVSLRIESTLPQAIDTSVRYISQRLNSTDPLRTSWRWI